MMDEIIGSFESPRTEAEVESLTLHSSPGSLPIKQRWRNNGLSADFLADYVATFFPRIEDDPASEHRRREIGGAVKYIANELLENAMKYSRESAPQPITIILQLDHERIAFWAINTVDEQQASKLRHFLTRLAASDPNDLYLEQLQSDDHSHSGLGFLTMINDYSARLAWRLETISPDTVTVTAQVTIAI